MNKLKNISFNDIMRYMGLLIVVVIFLLGLSILLTNYFNYIPQNMKWIFALLIMSYAALRFVNNLSKFKKNEED